MIKKLLGIAPWKTEDGAFSPSPLSLKLSTSSVTDYDNAEYPDAQKEGMYKVLMICTEERNMTMKNGKQFSTGNHPVEMLVPLLHFKKAGFETDVYTPTGKPAKIEMWAFPDKDPAVEAIYQDLKEKFDHPKSLVDFVDSQMATSSNYLAVFIPGGHGAMLGLPENENLKHLINWAHNNDILMLSICHGPAALLAAKVGEKEESFIYDGYKMAVFPDSVDKQAPLIGYLPGHLTWNFGNKLKSHGVDIINSKADNTCYQDRNLITGASPKAANDFGKLGAKALIMKMKNRQAGS